MVYASETWTVRVEEEQRMERNDVKMDVWSHFEGYGPLGRTKEKTWN